MVGSPITAIGSFRDICGDRLLDQWVFLEKCSIGR
jgi:hypothetical protein